MYYHLRRTVFGVIFLCITVFVLVEFLLVDDLPLATPTYDAKHLKLLKDYKARRTKKSRKVMVIGPTLYATSNDIKIRGEVNIDQLNAVDIEAAVQLSGDNTSTSIDDLFIGVKSSGKFHKVRLPLLLDTWIPFARQATFLITDVDDEEVKAEFEPDHYHVSRCSSSHHRVGLVCKVSVAYDLYILKPRRWFCMADDDTYINIPNLVYTLAQYDHTKDWYIGKPSLKYPIRVNINNRKESFWFLTGGAGYCISQSLALKMIPYARGGKLRELANSIRIPDDVAVGYIINSILAVDITRVPTFHSHLEGLWRISPYQLKDQVTLSYGEFSSSGRRVTSNVVNTGGIIPTFPPPTDPTRLRSVHCYLYPNARECSRFGIASL